jgi:CBS domain containing-hemolysin-like protein
MQPDVVFLLLSVVVLGAVAGTYAAMQLLCYVRAEKNGEGNAAHDFLDRLFENSVSNYFSLALGRALALGLVLVTSYRLAGAGLAGGTIAGGGLFVMLGAVFIPLLGANMIAVRSPEKFVEICRFVTYPVIYILKPLVYLFIAVLERTAPRVVDRLAFPVLPFKKRIELSGYDGHEDTDEQKLMSSVFEFGDTRVREVMIPRIDMVAVNRRTGFSEILDVIVEGGHSRVPVFDESIDKIVGVIHTKDLLGKTLDVEEVSLEDLMREVYFVPETKMIDELLSEFKKRKIHIAIVVDEYGGTAGLITLEDVLEELVGDIQDEFDAEEELIQRQGEDAVLCNSRVRLDDLNEALGLDLPERDVDTLGGFLYEMVGRVPRVGEVFSRGELEFRVHSVVGQRIDKVLIKGLSQPQGRVRDNTG